jgi:hypothetical protein
MSSRFVILALVASLGSSSMAFAEESLLQSSSRIAREVASAQGPARASTTRPMPSSEAFRAQEGPTLVNSGMPKRTKMLIYLAIGVGFAATAYAIDRKVVNVTPSSLGTRQD